MAEKQSFSIDIQDVQKSFGSLEVLRGLNITIRAGEFIALVGHSGCGKSTLLRLIAGLDEPTGGRVLLGGEPVKKLSGAVRYLFQEPRLLPWETIEDNVGLGAPRKDKARIAEILEHVGLKDKTKQWPKKLSGGQKQRTALARALISDPGVLLLDEPLGALDALTKIEMQRLIESLWFEKQFTAILVTHDVDEAVTLADRVFVINNGTIRDEVEISLARPRLSSGDKAYFTSRILKEILAKELSAPEKLSADSFTI
jgi:sulfonate transport system ATP-binding protein